METYNDKCPKCNSENISHDIFIEDGEVYNDICECQDCKFEFRLIITEFVWV